MDEDRTVTLPDGVMLHLMEDGSVTWSMEEEDESGGEADGPSA